MKKVVLTILAFLYLIVSSGATINFHYCMGRLTGWDMSTKQQSNCGKCSKPDKNDRKCCSDQQKVLKATKDQKLPESQIYLLKSFAVVVNRYADFSISCNSIAAIIHPNANAPPAGSAPPIYIRHCNFRI